MDSWYQKPEISLKKTNKVYNVEVILILEGLRQVLKSVIARVVSGIHICLDNLKVAYNTGEISKSSNQSAFRQFKDLAKGWLQTSKELIIQWIPGYAKYEKNKLANQKAKKYTKLSSVIGLNLH